jgi:hypothetical protein
MEREVQGLEKKNGGDETNDWLPVWIWIAAWVPTTCAPCVCHGCAQGEQVEPRGEGGGHAKVLLLLFILLYTIVYVMWMDL